MRKVFFFTLKNSFINKAVLSKLSSFTALSVKTQDIIRSRKASANKILVACWLLALVERKLFGPEMDADSPSTIDEDGGGGGGGWESVGPAGKKGSKGKKGNKGKMKNARTLSLQVQNLLLRLLLTYCLMHSLFFVRSLDTELSLRQKVTINSSHKLTPYRSKYLLFWPI